MVLPLEINALLRHVLVLAACLLLPAGGFATDGSYETEYRVSLGVMPVARLAFRTEVSADRYRIFGRLSSVGLVDMLREMAAQSEVSGTIRGSVLQPQQYRLSYRNGRKSSVYDVAYAAGNVVSSRIEPPPGPRSPRWVPLSEADLKAVADPITALLIPQDGDVCARRLRIYDGEGRMDLVLSSPRIEPIRLDGAKTEALVCAVRYIPRSGYRKGRRDIEHLADARGMEIWFAKSPLLPLYAPVYAKIPSRYGMVHVRAKTFDD